MKSHQDIRTTRKGIELWRRVFTSSVSEINPIAKWMVVDTGGILLASGMLKFEHNHKRPSVPAGVRPRHLTDLHN